MLQLLAVVDDIMTVNDWSIVDNVFAHRNEFSHMSTPCDVEQQIPLLVQKNNSKESRTNVSSSGQRLARSPVWLSSTANSSDGRNDVPRQFGHTDLLLFIQYYRLLRTVRKGQISDRGNGEREESTI